MRQTRDSRPTASLAAVADASTLSLLAAADDEEARQRRILRTTVAGALAVHAILMLVPLPEAAAVVATDPERARIVIVPTPRFKPPEIPPQPEIPTRRPFVVPVPDPTPHEPEPIRLVEAIEHDFEPTDAVVFTYPPEPPPGEADGPIEIGGAVARPISIDAPQPIYPEIARRARIQGTVLLRAVIDTSGRVTDLKVVEGLSFGLTEAAVTAVERWVYRPATLNSKPVAVYMDVTVNFRLQ